MEWWMRMLAASAVAATLPTPSRNAPPAPPAAAASAGRSAAGRAGVAHERQLGFHLGVFRKAERHRRVDRAARGVEAVRPRPQPRRHVVSVADEDHGKVDEQPIARGRRDREAPQDRARERVTHGARFGGVGRQRAELVVRLHHEDPGAGAFELHDARARQDAAVEADVVRPEAGGEPGRVEHFGVELRDLEPETAAGLVQIKREEAVDLLHAADAFFYRCDLIAARPPAALCALRAGATLREGRSRSGGDGDQADELTV